MAEIIRKGLRDHRPLNRHRPDARNIAHRPARSRADARAARARRLRPWDHHELRIPLEIAAPPLYL